MQNKTPVFDKKKVVTRFDKKKKIATWQKKSVDEEKNLLQLILKNKISEDSKKTLSLRTLKRILSMGKLQRTLISAKPKDNAINEDSQELQDPQ